MSKRYYIFDPIDKMDFEEVTEEQWVGLIGKRSVIEDCLLCVKTCKCLQQYFKRYSNKTVRRSSLPTKGNTYVKPALNNKRYCNE